MPGPRDVDRQWLMRAIDLSRLSTPAATRYAVGAVVVGPTGAVLATGYTGEVRPTCHAEEAALARIAGRPGVDATGAVLYSSLEPCTTRRSGPLPCARLIVEAGIRKVVFALREPRLFADCEGMALLERAGVDVVECADLAQEVRDVNAHLLTPSAGSHTGGASGRADRATPMRHAGRVRPLRPALAPTP